MSIEEFLAEIFVDFYEQMMLATGEIPSSEEFDLLFYDDDDSEEQMSDCEFVGKYCEEICNDEIIDGVYYYLIDDGCDFDFSLEKMVSHFVIDYIYNNYGNKSLVTIMNYLKKTDIKDVTEFFRSNEYFGKSLIESYIKNYEADVDYEEVRENATNNGDQELIDKWNRLSADYCSLNEMLRRVIVGLYDYYVSTGCDDITALSNTWAYFYRDFDPVGELDNMGVDFDTKQRYKAYVVKVMFADVYEDILNGSIIDSVNVYDRITDNFIVTSVNFNMCAIPKEEQIRNRFLKHFILLHYEKEKRIKNRTQTIKEGRGEVLKKFHPGHALDVIDFAKK